MTKKKKLDITKELLEEMYKDYSQNQIANELGVSEKTIRRRFKEYNIPIKPKSSKPKLKKLKKKAKYRIKEDFEKVYNDVKSVTLVAKYYNIDVKTAWKWKNYHQIPTIPQGVTERSKPLEVGAMTYRDKKTMYDLYVNKGMSTYDISNKFGCATSTIQKWMKVHGIPMRNLEEQWVVKSKNSVSFIQDNTFNKELYLANYKNIKKLSKNTYKFIVNKIGECQCCGYDEVLDIHHIDEDSTNNAPSNLIILCPNCHAKIHRLGLSVNDICFSYINWFDII